MVDHDGPYIREDDVSRGGKSIEDNEEGEVEEEENVREDLQGSRPFAVRKTVEKDGDRASSCIRKMSVTEFFLAGARRARTRRGRRIRRHVAFVLRGTLSPLHYEGGTSRYRFLLTHDSGEPRRCEVARGSRASV